jgi:hypothetical protein
VGGGGSLNSPKHRPGGLLTSEHAFPSDLSEIKVRERFNFFTSMVRSPNNLSVDSLRIPKWLHPSNGHSIEPYKIKWSSSKWPDLVDLIS